jgi:hypothetical protein
LGRFPKEDEHCAFLAAESLQSALDDYMRKQIAQNAPDKRCARSEVADGGKT